MPARLCNTSKPTGRNTDIKKFTEKIIATAMKEDDEVTSDQARLAMGILKGEQGVGSHQVGEEDRILVPTSEAVRLLSISRQTLWRLEKQGVVTPVILGHTGGHRIKRYSLESLRKLAR